MTGQLIIALGKRTDKTIHVMSILVRIPTFDLIRSYMASIQDHWLIAITSHSYLRYLRED